MNSYKSRKAISSGSIFFIVFFILVFVGIGYLFYMDQGKFWDYSLYIFIPAVVINLILLVFYLIKRGSSGYIFLLFFLIFLALIILSSFLGPFALINSARESYGNEQYSSAIKDFKEILDKYPNSKHSAEALKNISYAHYMNDNYEDAIYYFQKAIEDEVIDGDTLEIKKIFSDSNLKIAEYYFNKKDFEKAMEYYYKSVGYFKEIVDNFPDTNDAFIAAYKIPEYLYLAASSASNAELWEKSNEILNNIINDYPESEFSEKSKEHLFYNILRNVNDLKSSGNNRESIEEFLKIFSLEEEVLNVKQSEIDYYKEYLLRSVRATMLVQLANELYYSSEHEKAIFVYDFILENYPDYEETIVKNIVESKNRITAKSTYAVLEVSDPVGSFSKAGTSKISLENKTDYDLIQYMGGPEYRIIRLEKQTKTEIEVTAGSYKIVTELDNPENDLFYGEIDYEEGKIYRRVYELQEENNSKNP